MRSLILNVVRAGIAAGTSTLLAGALLISPAHAEAIEPVVDLAFQEDVLCTSGLMAYGVDVTNNGDPVTVRITKSTPGSIVSNEVDLANGESTTASIDTTHYKIIRLLIAVNDVTLYDSGQITSTGAGSGECNLPLPAVRNDIAFDVTASCSGITANYTITASTAGPSALVELTWVGKNGVPSYPSLVVDGQATHTEIVEIGVVTSVGARDAWGRSLYNSGELIADGDGCPRPAQHALTPKMDVECVDGGPVLYVYLLNSGDFTEFYYFDYQIGHEDEEIGESSIGSLAPGETFELAAPFAAGKAVVAELSEDQYGEAIAALDLSELETTCNGTPAGDGGEPTNTTAPGNGSQAPVADPQAPTAPVTPEAPRSLPSTGRTSTSLVLVAAALLLSGVGMRLAGRRQG